ncbi:hypothetical protein [Peptoniphilus catoniae]|uniref:hypothetical protein n=1 Tax=Peptoniphilus catoniae TaxID=1660341 RepID=UPI0010FE8C8E|nr:hypothetical protein [Peptoniphilus catoniae]
MEKFYKNILVLFLCIVVIIAAYLAYSLSFDKKLINSFYDLYFSQKDLKEDQVDEILYNLPESIEDYIEEKNFAEYLTKNCLDQLTKKRNIPELNLYKLDDFSYEIDDIKKLSKGKYRTNLTVYISGTNEKIKTDIRVKKEDGKRKIDYINLKDLQKFLENANLKINKNNKRTD